MSWQEDLNKILENGCTDSDLEDFISEHPNVSGRDIWDYVYDYNALDGCKGCKYIYYSGKNPCSRCSRRVEIKDYYESR